MSLFLQEIFQTPRDQTVGNNGKVKESDAFRFDCAKNEGLNVDMEALHAPEFDGGRYDARGADMWALGMMMFYVLVGSPLYKASDNWGDAKGGYWAVRNGQLRAYLAKKHLLALFKRDCFGLLEGLLNSEAKKRIDAESAAKHPWFESLRKSRDKHGERVKHVREWSSSAVRETFPYYKK